MVFKSLRKSLYNVRPFWPGCLKCNKNQSVLVTLSHISTEWFKVLEQGASVFLLSDALGSELWKFGLLLTEHLTFFICLSKVLATCLRGKEVEELFQSVLNVFMFSGLLEMWIIKIRFWFKLNEMCYSLCYLSKTLSHLK